MNQTCFPPSAWRHGAYLVRKAGSKNGSQPLYLRGNHWTPLKSLACVYPAKDCREVCDLFGGVPEPLYPAFSEPESVTRTFNYDMHR